MKKIALCQLPYQNDFTFQQELLLFDKIIIPETLFNQRISTFKNLGWNDSLNELMANVEFLIDNDKLEIVNISKQIDKNVNYLQDEKNIRRIKSELSEKNLNLFLKKLEYVKEKEKYINSFINIKNKLREEIENSDDRAMKIIAYTSLKKKYDTNILELSSILDELVNPNIKTIPVNYPDKFNFNLNNLDFKSINKTEKEILLNTRQQQFVTNVVLKKMPIPVNKSLEDIISFTKKEDNIRKLRDLNHWIKEMVNADLNKYEIENEINYLMSEYERLYKLNNMRYTFSKTQIIINTTLGTLEKLIKIKWSELANSFFEIKKATIDKELIEAQLKGREMAYLLEIDKITTANNVQKQ